MSSHDPARGAQRFSSASPASPVADRTAGRWHWQRWLTMVLAVLFMAAPVAGDIGSCNQPVEELDPYKFFFVKKRIDCLHCNECEFDTQTCLRACADEPIEEQFPAGCYPLVHDGEVCLEALDAAGCGEYAHYVDDVAPETPTECNFCPLDQRPEGT